MTKRSLKRDFEDLLAKADETLTDAARDRVADELDTDELGPATDRFDVKALSVEWADAHPTEWSTGIQWDPDTATVTYDPWAAQRECHDRLTDDADLVGFVAGYGSGKSILGARWLLAQAIAHPGSRFLAMGVDFTKTRDTTFRFSSNTPGAETRRPNQWPNRPRAIADRRYVHPYQ